MIAGRSSSFGKGVVAFRPLPMLEMVDVMAGVVGERGRRMADGGGESFRDLVGGVLEFLLFTLMDIVWVVIDVVAWT
jgi:hypothetical protein